MSPKRSATNQRAYGLLLLTLVGFGATTLLLSFRLMSAETLDRSVSPRTLDAEEQQFVRVSASHFTETSHDTRPPWRPNFRRNRGRGANKRASSMLQTHYRQEHKPLTTNRTIDNPCPNGKKSRSDNTGIPRHCTGYSLPFTTTNVPIECWPRIFLLPSYPTSGNELVHVLFQRITSLISFNSFPLGQAAFNLSTLNHAGPAHYRRKCLILCENQPMSKADWWPRYAVSKWLVAFTNSRQSTRRDWDMSLIMTEAYGR